MNFICEQSALHGAVTMPGSKSHTIRAVAIASLADGTSTIDAPLCSADTQSAAEAFGLLGAEVRVQADRWEITGTGAALHPKQDTIDVGNSGTTLHVLMGAAGLLPEASRVTLTGDRQIRSRPSGPLIRALNDLGASATSVQGNDCAPVVVGGRLRGGRTVVEAKSSQYVTSLLLACPLADGDTIIDVPVLFEKPYIEMTLDWLAGQDVKVQGGGLSRFQVTGGHSYRPFHCRIPADFSSATFFFGAGALPGNDVSCLGLDMGDSQADKAVVEYVRAMGAAVTVSGQTIGVRARQLDGIEIDMNATPDALPVMAVLGCFAGGRTVLRNVAHARIKETDRIAVMACELRKMGARIDELEDGLIVHESALQGAAVDGHEDHRVVMALALAGLNCPGTTTVAAAEAAGITFPTFHTLMQSIGGRLTATT